MKVVLVHGNPETDTIWGPLVDALGRDDVVKPCAAPFLTTSTSSWLRFRVREPLWEEHMLAQAAIRPQCRPTSGGGTWPSAGQGVAIFAAFRSVWTTDRQILDFLQRCDMGLPRAVRAIPAPIP